ncbi:MAG: (5-formylfuran-3-yl)methyl phosphate synthase [Planctomycetaceae bacterium]
MSAGTAPPRLLVSVRNVEEAHSAFAGGADIIDVKDPDRGSLGRADAEVIGELASLSGLGSWQVPLSVALGEVHEYGESDAIALPQSVGYAKLGLARLRSNADWVARWTHARHDYDRRRGSPVRWIAVIYADAERAQAPPAREIAAAAASTGCVGVLVDTYCKSSGRLLDHVTTRDLAEWAHLSQRLHLMFAVAGRLSLQDLPQILPVSPDIVAVRSAVCERHDRRAAVCQDRIADFKRAMQVPPAEALAHRATR